MVLKISCKRGGGVKRRPRKVRAGYRYSSRKLVQLSPRYFVAGKSDLSCCIASRGIPKFFAARVGFCNVSGLQQDSLCLRAVLFARVVCTKVSTDTRELYKLLKVSASMWRMKRKYPESRWKYRIYVKVFRYRNRIVSSTNWLNNFRYRPVIFEITSIF